MYNEKPTFFGFIKFLFGKSPKEWSDPHVTDVVELTRASSPDLERDAVLVLASGRNAWVVIVPHGRPPHFGTRVAGLVHCTDVSEMKMSWHSPQAIEIVGDCEDANGFGASVSFREGITRIELS